MISRDSVQTLLGGTAYSSDGDKIGSVGQVYLDNDTNEPAWVTVKTGLLGSSESFVPLDQAELTDDGLRVPYDKDRVKGAPNIETDRQLSEQDEDQLYDYYGLTGTGGAAGTGQGYTDTTSTAGYRGQGRTEGYDVSGPTTDEAMTRSEERVRAGTESREAGRARLRKCPLPTRRAQPPRAEIRPRGRRSFTHGVGPTRTRQPSEPPSDAASAAALRPAHASARSVRSRWSGDGPGPA
jgi:sporulation protein YlmC with PRC-barrel domain